MKFILFLACVLLFVNSCYCKCDCNPNDNACISDCVVEANNCVTSCHGNIECYESCIDDKWPTSENSDAIEEIERQEEARNSGIYKEVLATTTVYSTISASSTYTATASTSVKQAEQSHTSSALNLVTSTTVYMIMTLFATILFFSQ